MPTPKRGVPVEVLQRAEAVLTKRYTIAPAPKAAAPAPKKKATAKDKVVVALKRLHPMD